MRLQRDKRGFSFDFLLQLIIGLMLAAAVIYAGAKIGSAFFGLTASASESFAKLHNSIKESANSAIIEQKKHIGLDMDKGTAIFGFSKNSNEVKRVESLDNIGSACDSDASCKALIKRPGTCEIGKACICLCRDYGYDAKLAKDKMHCQSKPLCTSFDSFDLLGAYHSTHLESSPFSRDGYIIGGFVLTRINNNAGQVVLPDVLQQTEFPPRSREVTIQKYKGLIAVCLKDECLNDETKRIMELQEKKSADFQAKKSFAEFAIFLSSCSKDSTKCGTRVFEDGYNLYYIPRSKGNDAGAYLVNEQGFQDIEKNGLRYDDNKFIKIEKAFYYSKDEEFGEGYIFTNNFARFGLQEGKIIVIS